MSDKYRRTDIPIYSPSLIDVFSQAPVLFGGNDGGYCYMGGAGAITATEANAQLRMPAGRVRAINGNCYDAASDMTFTLRKNGEDTGLTGTLSSTGQFHITSGGPVTFADGDLASLAYDTATGGGFGVRGIQLEIELGVV